MIKFKTLSLAFTVLLLAGCYSIQKLPDGHTTITTDQRAYKNKEKFSLGLTAFIDTNAVYEEYCYVNAVNKERTYHYHQDTHKDYYRFYSNGYCNCFSVKSNATELNHANFDPAKTGYRGVYYQEKNGTIKLDLFTQIGELSSLRSSYGLSTRKITLSGDSLFMQKEGDMNYHIYLKRKATKEIQDMKGW